MKKFYVGIGAVVAGFLLACSAPAEPNDNDVDRLNDIAAPSVAASSKNKAPEQLTAGTWKLGKKENLSARVITSGNYVIATPETGILCYWQRVRNFSGEFSGIIANGNVAPGKDTIVEVKATDKGLVLEGDCLAKKEKTK